MSGYALYGKKVLVTLPLTEKQKSDFRAVVQEAGGEVAFVREPQVTSDDVTGVAIIVGNVPVHTLSGSPDLEWLQTSSAGYDHYLDAHVLAHTTMLTSATGCYGQAVSEHMLAQLLCLMKKLHLYRDNQMACSWHDEGSVQSLVDAVVLVVGAGDIGTSFAGLVHAMGARVWGVRRRVNAIAPPYERMVSLDDLFELLPQADVVACAIPSSAETRGLADAAFFSAMRPGAYFINAGRGDLVQSDDLAAALASGHLAGAALDVTSPEPLPPDNALWLEPHALITPHVAGFWHLQATTDNVVRLCMQNLQAYSKGQPLQNVVRRP